jgi:hypothetical protein
MNGQNTNDVHTSVANVLSKVNHRIVVKLNTYCVQNVVTTWRGGLGRPLSPALGLTQMILGYLSHLPELG